jgi:hypothetical protein
VAAQKAVTARRASADEVRPFARRAERFCTTSETLESLIAEGECWVVEEGGTVVAGWSQQWQGRNLHVLIYGGRADIDLSLVLNACLEAQRPESASFQTRRPGLIRKGIEQGYRVVRQLPGGVVMKKEF